MNGPQLLPSSGFRKNCVNLLRARIINSQTARVECDAEV